MHLSKIIIWWIYNSNESQNELWKISKETVIHFHAQKWSKIFANFQSYFKIALDFYLNYAVQISLEFHHAIEFHNNSLKFWCFQQDQQQQ